jgi:hypothetical protein
MFLYISPLKLYFDPDPSPPSIPPSIPLSILFSIPTGATIHTENGLVLSAKKRTVFSTLKTHLKVEENTHIHVIGMKGMKGGESEEEIPLGIPLGFVSNDHQIHSDAKANNHHNEKHYSVRHKIDANIRSFHPHISSHTPSPPSLLTSSHSPSHMTSHAPSHSSALAAHPANASDVTDTHTTHTTHTEDPQTHTAHSVHSTHVDTNKNGNNIEKKADTAEGKPSGGKCPMHFN